MPRTAPTRLPLVDIIHRGLQWEATRYHYFRSRRDIRRAEDAKAAYAALRAKLPPEDAISIPFL